MRLAGMEFLCSSTCRRAEVAASTAYPVKSAALIRLLPYHLYALKVAGPMVQASFVARGNAIGSEDCLYLNIWAPSSYMKARGKEVAYCYGLDSRRR